MSSVIEFAKQDLNQNINIFLRNFSRVPDDQLNWAPTPTAKSALRIAAHTSLYLGRFAKMIQEQKLPQVDDLDSWLAQIVEEESAVMSKQQVIDAFRIGEKRVHEAYDSLKPEDINKTLGSGPEASLSMAFLIKLPAWHTVLHLGQIDYLQTCWNDQNVYTD